MTEQQAIRIIKEEKSWESDDRKIDAFIIAVDAIEEIQKYRAIGTLEELNSLITESEEEFNMLIEYIAIGTPNECRAAVEKQQTMDWDAKYDECVCPKCGTLNTTWEKRANTVKHDKVYCWHCGQSVEFRLE